MKTFQIHKNPYDSRKIFLHSSLTLEDNNIYCLVGCNGSGKSTLISEIKQSLLEDEEAREVILGYGIDLNDPFSESKKKEEDKDIIVTFDKDINPRDSMEEYYNGSLKDLLGNLTSTGENYKDRISNGLKYLREIIYNHAKDKKLYLIFDDIDVSLSIDVIRSINNTLKLIVEDCKKANVTYYIILGVNNYELVQHYPCIDVIRLKIRHFKSYKSYANFVIKSSLIKEELQDKFYEKVHKN